jgi:hypothetical protein
VFFYFKKGYSFKNQEFAVAFKLLVVDHVNFKVLKLLKGEFPAFDPIVDMAKFNYSVYILLGGVALAVSERNGNIAFEIQR